MTSLIWDTTTPLTTLNFPGLPLFKTGKVRSVFDLGDTLLLVASDRISAFDVILPEGIPQKGEILTKTTKFWCQFLADIVPNHLLSTDSNRFPEAAKPYLGDLKGRTMWVKKTQLIEVECVVRGYLAGSGWKEYQQSGTVCGIALPPGLRQADQLPEPIFTPAYKAPQGAHDENITFAQMEAQVGKDLAQKLREISIALFKKASVHLKSRGLILADTKFEFGLLEGNVILIDEVLTPDSSRFWDAKDYQPGTSPPSFDKQIIRDYLESIPWDKTPPGPHLPQEIKDKTSQKYKEALQRICS